MCVSWGSETNRFSKRNVTGVNSALMFRQVRAAGQKYLSSGNWRAGGRANRRWLVIPKGSEDVVKSKGILPKRAETSGFFVDPS